MANAAALQQQVFALDARYNAHRAPNNPNFRTLYIRRRSQLLRETEREPETWKRYLKTRSQLLNQRYGSALEHGSHVTRSASGKVCISRGDGDLVPTRQAEASRAIVGGNTIGENYAFVGVHHIFDQHTEAVTMVKFANNDKSRLCCSSLDNNLSVCRIDTAPPSVVNLLKGHTKAVTGFDWSANNDSIASCSLDGTIKVWKVSDASCLRTIKDPGGGQLLCCLFRPINNNLLIAGNTRGDVQMANVSTGLFMKNVCRIGGNVLSIASDADGRIVWVGNDKGEIVSVLCEIDGTLRKTRRLHVAESSSVTSLSYRAWISREARDPMLLVNCTENTLCLFRIVDGEGGLRLKRKFDNKHEKHFVKSTFCPLMSFRQGACVVTGSEDGNVYFINIEKAANRACVNTLQGHSTPILGVTFNYDESLLATADLQGLVIVWKRSGLS